LYFKVLKLNYATFLFLFVILFSSIFLYNFVFASADSLENNVIKLPIIMYHSVLKDPARSGKYIITPSTLESDLKYIAEKGYHTITMTDLIHYVYNKTPLPENPIILTFDDGYYNNLTYVLPLLEKYDMKAVVSIVGAYTNTYTKLDEANANYSYLRWKDIQALMDTGRFEFQNHTYNLHSEKNGRKGASKKKGETQEQYASILSQDIGRLQQDFKEATGYLPNTFTYPFGLMSKDSKEIIQSLGFKASLSCAEGINSIQIGDYNCLYYLKRYNRSSFISTDKFFQKIFKAMKK
jgi:polysaccharide deacetylase